ncbi:MAG: acetyl-CoA carboxylase biotin carboxyl carrier protein, partial [Quisquiliibacterium sp.]
MDLRKLKTLIDLVSESGICELEITEGDGKVRIVKGAGAGGVAYAPPPQPAYSATAPPPVAAPAAAGA